MLSSHEVIKEGFFEDCPECGGSPPPEFYLPPPPCPSGLDEVWACPAAIETQGIPSSGDRKISVAVVVVTAATFVVLAMVAAIIVYRRRHCRRHQNSKGAPPVMGGAIIYDDLTPTQAIHFTPSASIRGRPEHMLWTPLLATSPSRYVPPSSFASDSRNIRHASEISAITEPLYHTISSGSGSSERYPGEASSLYGLPSAAQQRLLLSDSEEEDSLTPFLKAGHPAVNNNQTSKCYLGLSHVVPSPPSTNSTTPSSSHEYETVPLRTADNPNCRRNVGTPQYTGQQGGYLATLKDRGLPPLPSRSERFCMFLPSEKELKERDSRERGAYHRSPHTIEPFHCETVGVSSNL